MCYTLEIVIFIIIFFYYHYRNHFIIISSSSSSSISIIKVTIHVGTDQNIEIDYFAEYKYTLNELLVTKKCFSIRLIVCEI